MVEYFAFYDYMRQIGVAGYTAAYDSYQGTSELDLIYPVDGFTVVSQKPSLLKRLNGKLHCDGGPALSYADGCVHVWALNGVRVPQQIAETRAEELDPKAALSEKNVEVRREIIRKIGIERFIQAAGAKVLDTQGTYELLSVDLTEEIRGAKYLKMVNPSIGVYHIEGVHPSCDTVEKAINFRAGGTEWKPSQLT